MPFLASIFSAMRIIFRYTSLTTPRKPRMINEDSVPLARFCREVKLLTSIHPAIIEEALPVDDIITCQIKRCSTRREILPVFQNIRTICALVNQCDLSIKQICVRIRYYLIQLNVCQHEYKKELKTNVVLLLLKFNSFLFV
jgi:hypothetical protein